MTTERTTREQTERTERTDDPATDRDDAATLPDPAPDPGKPVTPEPIITTDDDPPDRPA